MSTDHHSGLEEVKVVPSTITLIEGSSLYYRGISITDLAENVSFEEVVYLLWYERLPGERELNHFQKEIQDSSSLPREVKEHILHLPRNVHPQSVLSHLISSLGIYDHEADETSLEARHRVAIRILARVPSIVFGYERYRNAKSLIEPVQGLSFAANCLKMLEGDEPDEVSTKALNTCLILYAEHELNAATFAARITTGTLADIYSAVVSASNTLKGSLTGGANQKSMEMILDIGSPDEASEWLDKKLEAKERIMGFGHRVYKQGDPRAKIMKSLCAEICQDKGYNKYFEIALAIEEYMKSRNNLLPNVDFYSAVVLYVLGFPIDLFTPSFTISRISGWIAHIREQYSNNRLIRPRVEYTGEKGIPFVPLSKRK